MPKLSIAAMSLPAALFVILVGPAAGSFVALLADRLPRGEPVLAARSACRSCGVRLGVRDLIPIVSFAALRGRCRHCGTVLPPWLLYAELLGLGGGMLAGAAGGGPVQIVLAALFLWLLLGLGLADLRWFRLPDPLTLALGLVAVVMALQTPPEGLAAGPPAALAGLALAGGVAWALRWGYRRLRGREGMGLGDVKLLAALGAYTGPLGLPVLLLIASLLALAGAVVARPPAGARTLAATRPIPFGAALALAAATLWILQQSGIALAAAPQ